MLSTPPASTRSALPVWTHIAAKVIAGKEQAGAKFSDYFNHREKWSAIPSHRALAILRAAKEEVVTVDIAPDPETGAQRAEGIVAHLHLFGSKCRFPRIAGLHTPRYIP